MITNKTLRATAAALSRRGRSRTVKPPPIAPIPISVATRKCDPLTAAMKKAMNALYAHGAVKTI